MTVAGAIVRSAAAWLVFGLGAISPLTPSEGHPDLVTLALFVAGPLLLLVWVGLMAPARELRVAGWIQFAAVAAIAWYVLSAVFGSPGQA